MLTAGTDSSKGAAARPRRFDPQRWSPRTITAVRWAANLVGALGAAWFARDSLRFYLDTHRLIGAAFLAEQLWVVAAYLIRRPARAVTRRLGDWALAFGGTFGGTLFRPVGSHPDWGVRVGLVVQLVGLAMCVVSFLALGRSFGFAAADRGLAQRGPYRVVRHPIYASYVLLLGGYVLQSMSIRNAVVMVFVIACDVGRARAEDRVLASNPQHAEYARLVRWRMVPGVW